MDLVDYSQEVYNKIIEDFKSFSTKLEVTDIRFVPISALKGDNIVDRSQNMNWYQGPTLLYLLETIHIASDFDLVNCRFPVQSVIRPFSDEFHDYRGYAGRVSGGIFKPGDTVMALPSGFTTTIKQIDTFNGSIAEAYPPMSVTLLLQDEIDISRGDMIVRENNVPQVDQDIDVMIVWMNEKPLKLGGKYSIRHTTKDLRCLIKDIKYKVDINTLHRNLEDKNIGLNEIARVSIRTTQPLFFDKYKLNRITGSIILIDEGTNETLGAGMII
jgi:sulfate adenylyltransferase subunit 1